MALAAISNQPRVLVVNDDPEETNAFVNALKKENIDTIGCCCPFEAISIAGDNRVDVVLVDLMIPDMNGLQLARTLRQKYPHIITMLMSDYLLSPVQLAKADSGIVGFVPKPCRFRDLGLFIEEKARAKNFGEEEHTTTSSVRSISDAPFDVLSVQFSV